MITVVMLSTPNVISQEAVQCLKNAGKLYLQSDLHPSAVSVKQLGITYETMDDLYERSYDFDELMDSIAGRLLAAGDCVYALCGSGVDILPALRKKTAGKNTISVIPCVGIGKAAFAEYVRANVYCPDDLPDQFDITRETIIEEVDSRIIAGELKLVLSDFFPDEHVVTLARMKQDGSFSYTEFPLFELDRQKKYDAATVLLLPPVPFEKQERYGFTDMMKILEYLRLPDGCPWDREQTHASLQQCMLEETYEAMDAVDRDDMDALCEELGDVLMQAGLHACIAKECGDFSIRDVTTTLAKKLIFRHPHVFLKTEDLTTDQVLRNWEELKKQEKEQKTGTETLKSVPQNFPALLRVHKLLKRAEAAGVKVESEKLGRALLEMLETSRFSQDGDTMAKAIFLLTAMIRAGGEDAESLLKEEADRFIRRFEESENVGELQEQATTIYGINDF